MKILPRQIKCRSMLEALGLSRSGASALTGNFCVESGPSLPTAFRSRNLDHGSNGLAQWRLGRLQALKNYVRSRKPELIEDGMSEAEIEAALWPWYGRLDFQTQFVVKELQSDYSALYAKLAAGGDVAALAADVCWQYERPNKAMSHISTRIAWAKAIATVDAEPALVATTNPANMGVADHLHVSLAKHAKQQTGDMTLAAGGAFAAIGLAASNFLPSLPTWELAVLGGLVVVAGVGAVAAMTQAKHVANVKAALAGVSKVPPPAPKVDIPAPAMPKAAPLEVNQAASSGLVGPDGRLIVVTVPAAAPSIVMQVGGDSK